MPDHMAITTILVDGKWEDFYANNFRIYNVGIIKHAFCFRKKIFFKLHIRLKINNF